MAAAATVAPFFGRVDVQHLTSGVRAKVRPVDPDRASRPLTVPYVLRADIARCGRAIDDISGSVAGVHSRYRGAAKHQLDPFETIVCAAPAQIWCLSRC
jgi:hypothetical protein